MSGRDRPGGWGCIKGSWSLVAVGWSEGQGCVGAGMGPWGDTPVEQRSEQERTHAEKARVLLPVPGCTVSWDRGNGPKQHKLLVYGGTGRMSGRGLPSNPAKERTLGEPCDLPRGLP